MVLHCRASNGIAGSPSAAFAQAGDGFWHRLAAAAAAAVSDGAPAPPTLQHGLHTQTQQLTVSSSGSGSRQHGSVNSAAPQQEFATRATKASRSSGRQAAAAKDQTEAQAAAAAKPKGPTGPTEADLATAERER